MASAQTERGRLLIPSSVADAGTHVRVHLHTHTYTDTFIIGTEVRRIYIYIYIYINPLNRLDDRTASGRDRAHPEICFDRVGEPGPDVEKTGETISGHGEMILESTDYLQLGRCKV